MKKITVSILSAMLMLSLVFSSSVFAAEKEVSAWDSFLGLFSGKVATADTQVDGVTYRTHIENDGWAQGWVSDGDMSGSYGRGLRLEGIEIKLDDATLPEGLGITYRTHIQNDGWAQGWVSDGEMSGSSGRGLRLEAIEIKLTGDNADDYSVVYRTHIQNDGWAQGWVKDGALSGSEGRGLRLEGIEIKIEQKTADLTAYEAALAAVKEADYTASSWAAYQAVVDANVVTADDLQSEVDAATAAIVAAQANLSLAPVPEAVKATSITSLTVTGVGLFNLTAADVTVENNSVVSYTAAADGKSAVVVLSSDLIVDEETDVTVNGVVFPVTYTVVVNTLEIVNATYDDDTPEQMVAVTMNGNTVTSKELIAAGYNLTFTAYQTKAATTDWSNVFLDDATGELVADISTSAVGAVPASGVNAYVQLTAVKGSTVIKSALSPITFKNINLAGDSITASTLTVDPSGDNIDLNSRTLVTGEQVAYTDITVKSGAESEVVADTALFKATSSNVAVVSVAADGLTLTAQGPGTATITLTYGKVTRTETITVTNTPRQVAKVTADPLNLTIAAGDSTTTAVGLLDQYGDPILVDTTITAVVNTGVPYATITTATQLITAGDEIDFEVNGVLKGIASIIFEDTAGAKIGTTTVRATVVADNTFAKYGLGITEVTDDTFTATYGAVATGSTGASDFTTDTTLDLQSDAYAIIDIASLTSSGVEITPVGEQTPTTGYTLTVDQSKTGVLDLTTITEANMVQPGYIVVKAGTLTGTATLTITNVTAPTITKSITLTVESVGYNLTNASLKTVASPTYAQNLNFEDVLYYTPSTNDDVLDSTKLTLTKSTGFPIRLDEATAMIYIDKGADGSYDVGTDIEVGSFEVSLVGTFANSATVDNIAGINVVSGDEGTVLFKVLDNNGGVVGTQTVVVDF